MTDVVRGSFEFDFHSGAVKGAAGKAYLDPEIGGEGTKVILSNGTEVRWSPPPARAVIPDWSDIKTIRHYFNRTDYQFFPCWLYHPTEDPVIVRTAQEAGERYGVELLERTDAERAEFGGGKYRWKFHGAWRVTPYHVIKPSTEAGGKNLEVKRADPITELARVIGQRDQRSDMSGINPAMLEEFRAFQAWKAQQVPAFAEAAPPFAGGASAPFNASKESELVDETGNGDPERQVWIAKAIEADIKIDDRWTTETLKRAVTNEMERRRDVLTNVTAAK